MEKAGLLDAAIAPLRWVERARGWRRAALLLIYAVVAVVGGLIGWREVDLRRIPWSPEPFDLAKYGTVDVPDVDNAIIDYRKAASLLKPFDFTGHKVDFNLFNVLDWSASDPEVRRWVEENREATAAWLGATDRPDSLLVQPGEVEVDTDQMPVYRLQDFSRIALLDASRLEQAGDLEGAWRMYRGALRSSRHAGRHGGSSQRMVGQAILNRTRPAVDAWIAHPSVTPALLRRAIADVEACAAMTPPASEMARADYRAARVLLDHPEFWRRFGVDDRDRQDAWYDQYPIVPWTRRFLRHEPERSRRILRLIAAGQLAQCDRPRADRPRLASPRYSIYEVDGATPPALRSVAPAGLEALARDSVGGSFLVPVGLVQSRTDFEPGTFDQLRLSMAERAYQLDRGVPPKTYGELVGAYLKALPEGYAPGDPTTAGSAEPPKP